MMSKITEKIFKGSKHYITSNFGDRSSIVVNGVTTPTFHNGTDYGTDGKKLPQYALEKGTIVNLGTDQAGAKFVVINYPRLNVNMSHYHLDSIKVSKNQQVDNNTIIGYTGKTGLATGIHLHLAIYDLNKKEYVDPEVFAETYEEETSDVSFKVGDKVVVNGTLYSNSYGGKAGKTLVNHEGIITIVNLKGTKPYHIDKLGWVAKENISTNANVKTYTVVKGDTLSRIAKKFNTTWQIIYEDNKKIIGSNPNLIKPGQVLTIK